MEFFDFLTSKPLWLILAAAMGVLELLTFTGFFLGFAFAALVVYGGLWLWPDMPAVGVAGLFALVSVASSFAYTRLFKGFSRKTDAPLLNQRLARNIGHVGVAVEAFESGMGMVKIDDGFWRAREEGLAPIAAGDHVAVVGVEGDYLLVKPR